MAPEVLHQQLKRHLPEAHGGDAPSARRVAELYEGLDQPDDAETWWRVAAALGDDDAKEYVEGILS